MNFNSNSNNNNNSGNNKAYGRGSEIWPPTNTDRPIRLEDSFPQGQIPAAVAKELAAGTKNDDKSTGDSNDNNNKTWLDRFPTVLVVGLLGWVRPLDVGLVMSLSLYTALLALAARSVRRPNNNNNSNVPTMPSLPPQGHVPPMVQNPMLYDVSYSWGYDLWWKCGIGLGFVLPSLTHAFGLMMAATGAAKSSPSLFGNHVLLTTVARPLFLLSCQAVSELLCKDWSLPLPIRIWIPISYQVTRLVYLGMGFCTLLLPQAAAATKGAQWFVQWIQLVTGLNLVYTVANVFGFLLPVALIRYMRAHFWAVEAASVTLHPGMEESIGLSPPTPYYASSLLVFEDNNSNNNDESKSNKGASANQKPNGATR